MHRLRFATLALTLGPGLCACSGESDPSPEQPAKMSTAILPKRTSTRTTEQVVEAIRPALEKRFGKAELARLTDGGELLLVALKKEQKLEVWKKPRAGGRHLKELTFPFTGTSGKPGPKRQRGDRQIPEGVYRVSYLNANSKYHLSFKLNYPNAFDRRMAKADRRTDLGDDIFIHGNRVTIGCIPIGDPAIEVLFSLIAMNGQAHTRVVIAPHELRAGKPAPSLDNISWETELYEVVRKALEDATPPK